LVKEKFTNTKKYPKHNFGLEEFKNFNTTFWTTDEGIFVHPRNKVQIPFIFSVFCWTEARIGAFFPKPKKRGKPDQKKEPSQQGEVEEDEEDEKDEEDEGGEKRGLRYRVYQRMRLLT
jgi:hypothetical protein